MDNRCPEPGVAASPPPRRRNPDHPPYAEMVQAALRALAKKEASSDGFTEAAISRYITSAYPGIPPGHPKLLPYYLCKFVTARELSVSPSGRYLLPDSRLSEPIAPPPSFPRPNALLSRKSSLVLRFKKTISDGDGSGPKVGWCYVGDGSTSSPSVTDQQSGSVATKPGGESYPPVPALLQADPEKALLHPSASLVSDPNMEVLSLTLGGLEEPKESLGVPSPINKQQSRNRAGSKSRKAGGESGPPVPASMQAEPEKAPLPLSPSPASDINMEEILGVPDESKEPLVVLFPINKQQSGSKFRKRAVTKSRKREMRSETNKAGGELRPPVPASMQAEPEKAPSPSPDSDTNMEVTFPALGLDEPKESLTGLCPINLQQSEFRKQDGEPGSDANKAGEESHPSISISKQSEPEKIPLPPLQSPVSGSNMERILPTLGELDKPKEPLVVLSPINKQQSGSKSRKRAGTRSRKQVSRSEVMKRETRSETKKKVGELHHPVPASIQAEPEKVLSPSLVSPVPASIQAEPEKVLSPSPVSPVPASIQAEPENVFSPSPVSDTNMEVTSPALGLDESKESLCPINVQQSRSESRKQDGELESDAKKAGEESHPSVSISNQSEPEKALLPLSPSPVSDPIMEGISLTLGLVEAKESLAVQSSVEEQQLASKNAESHLPVPVSMQLEPEEALLPLSTPPLLALNLECTLLDKPKESSSASIPDQQSGSESGKQDGSPALFSIQAEPEKEPLLSPPILDRNMESTSLALRLDELKELSPVSPCITNLQPGSEPVKQDVDLLAPVSIQAQLEKARLSPPPPPVTDVNMERISPTLALNRPESLVVLFPITVQQVGSENGESSVALSPITEQQLGSENGESQVLTPIEQQLGGENGESHPPVPASMQIEPEEVLLPPPPSSDLNLEFTSPILGPDKPKESSPISAPIAEQKSENKSSKRDGEAHLPSTVSIYTKLENPPLLPPVSDLNMEWASQVLALNELKESSLVSHPITNQQSGSDPGKQDRESHLLAPDSKKANSEEVLSLPLPPSPPVLGQLQTEPVPYLPKKTSSPAPLNNEPNRERSSPALMLYELKESLPISTTIANQQSRSESSKIDADSHPPNSALMQQTDPGKEPPPPPISVQSQAEPEPKLSSSDCVPAKPLLALGQKKSLSKKPRRKHRRRLWYEM